MQVDLTRRIVSIYQHHSAGTRPAMQLELGGTANSAELRVSCTMPTNRVLFLALSQHVMANAGWCNVCSSRNDSFPRRSRRQTDLRHAILAPDRCLNVWSDANVPIEELSAFIGVSIISHVMQPPAFPDSLKRLPPQLSITISIFNTTTLSLQRRYRYHQSRS